MADKKTETKKTEAKAGKPMEGVEAYVASDGPQLDDDTAKDRFVEKVNQGNFTFTEPEVQALAAALGVEDEVEDAFTTFEGGENSPMAGLTPATGSGGTPYEADAATADTKKAAKAAQKDADAYADEHELTERQVADRRRLASSVSDE